MSVPSPFSPRGAAGSSTTLFFLRLSASAAASAAASAFFASLAARTDARWASSCLSLFCSRSWSAASIDACNAGSDV